MSPSLRVTVRSERRKATLRLPVPPILGAAPFAAMGFVNYNGMTAEQFVWAWLRSEMLEPKQIKFEPVNIYYEALKDAIDEREKEVSKHND